MKIVIFDVSNGFCGLAVCNNGYSLMLDCGSHTDKPDPVEEILKLAQPNSWLSHMKDFSPYGSKSYKLTLLSISHPDEDHIRNIENVKNRLMPAKLQRRKLEDFPSQILSQNDALGIFKEYFCKVYRHTTTNNPDWGFARRTYSIPMKTITDDPHFGNGKITNNSSYVTVLEYGGSRVVFGGDLETVGWQWLVENDGKFVTDIKQGIDVFVAPHHGHKSGFPEGLFDISGSPKLSILSKGREYKDKSDVDNRYSQLSTGLTVKTLNDDTETIKYSLTSRRNGTIYLNIGEAGKIDVYCEK